MASQHPLRFLVQASVAVLAAATVLGAPTVHEAVASASCSSKKLAKESILLQVRAGVPVEVILPDPPNVTLPKLTELLWKKSEEVVAKQPNNPHHGVLDIEHHFLGCYPRSAGDKKEAPVYMDEMCITPKGATSSAPCRSGLPFYRLRLQKGQGFQDCFAFCLTKGMDLSGIMAIEESEGEECRCGASAGNLGAWHGRTPPQEKQLPSQALPAADPKCKLLVWQYTGGLENNSMPYPLLQVNVEDERYIDSIADGRAVAEPEDGPFDSPKVFIMNKTALLSTAVAGEARGLCTDSQNTGVQLGSGAAASCSQLRSYCSKTGSTAEFIKGVCPVTCGICSTEGGWTPCYPNKCAAGSPWAKASDGKVRIPYYFDSNIDNQRKSAFLTAVDEWESKTCMRFSQGSSKPRIKVTITDYNSCTATVGNPGDGNEATLNMGWCKSSTDVGSIIHELGHIVGMAHTQNRPDASKSLKVPGGRVGPYLKVYWQNIPSNWKAQYLPNENGYVGSANQGNGDPVVGYGSYNYESIMHYGRGNPVRYDTVVPQYNAVVGQRNGLSEGDILQVSDMYQCSAPSSSSPSPSPPPSPSPSPSTTSAGGSSSGCQDTDPVTWLCDGQPCTCKFLKANNYCQDANYGATVRQSCPKSCNVCSTASTSKETTPTSTTTSTTPSTAATCQDSQPNLECNGQVCTCSQLQGFCTHADFGSIVQGSCKETCGLCSTAGSGCQDLGAPEGWTCNGQQCTCNQVPGYCENDTYGAAVKARCPVTCGTCSR
mmetsp:Transcript_79214/g.169691  ORF Transcript_79214/g.169691 Transcript_79214/m.169691 type:complete len:769 (+) Transcript_79214:53-2359(+)